mgnify:CR=1 FL=1
MKTAIFKLLLFAAFFVAIIGCTKEDQDISSDVIIEKDIVINNNLRSLNGRIMKMHHNVALVSITERMLKSGGYADDPNIEENFAFTLIAESLSPEYGGKTIQATHIDIYNNYAFVSFNMKGAEYLGGVQVFDVSIPENPMIISEAILPHIDVSSLQYFDNKLFLAGAYDPTVNDTTYATPAVIDILNLNATMQITGTDTIIDISSYVGTDISVGNLNGTTMIMCTAGDNGGVMIYNASTYSLEFEEDLPDARAIQLHDGKAHVLKNNPGEVIVYENNTMLDKYALPNDLTPDSKSELDVNGYGIFTAMNAGGLHYQKTNGTNFQHIPKPDVEEGALEENFVTNSVTVNDELVLIGNGGAGVYVGYVSEQRNDSIVLLGKMKFEGSESVNFVHSEDNLIFVASGLGGLKILTYELEDPYELKTCKTTKLDLASYIPESENNRVKRPQYFVDTLEFNLVTTRETDLYISFVHGQTSKQNVLGYYSYPLGEKPASADSLDLNIIFPHIAVNDATELPKDVKFKVNDTPFPENMVIGFFAILDGYSGPGDMSLNGKKYYTDIDFNNNTQQFILAYNPGCRDIILALEDTDVDSGDNDYNDAIFMISDNPVDTIITNSFDVTSLPKLIGED